MADFSSALDSAVKSNFARAQEKAKQESTPNARRTKAAGLRAQAAKLIQLAEELEQLASTQ